MSEEQKDNLFSEENEAQSGFFKFKNPGDAIKGTYIGKVEIPKKGLYPSQIGYELMTENGVIIAAFNVSKKYIHDSMKFAKLGQVVGFKFVDWFETEESKKNPNISKAKTIKVYFGGMDANYNAEMGGITRDVVNEVSFD